MSETRRTAEQSLNSHESITDKLHAAIYSILVFRKKLKLLMKLLHEVKQFGTAASLNSLGEIEEGVIRFIRQQLERGIAEKKMRDCDPEFTACILFKMHAALVFDWEKNLKLKYFVINQKVKAMEKEFIS